MTPVWIHYNARKSTWHLYEYIIMLENRQTHVWIHYNAGKSTWHLCEYIIMLENRHDTCLNTL